MLDLDHFKEVNDAGGHNVGDQLLQKVADIVTEHLHDGEVLGRLGGDEFAMILHIRAGPAHLGNRLRAILQDIHAHRLEDTPLRAAPPALACPAFQATATPATK